jgi:hypothetical protein
MTDFKIRRGRYDQLFDTDGNLRRDSVVLELGCWYLCTDEAWLYLCVENDNGTLDLKQINKPTAANRPTTNPDDEGEIGGLVNNLIYVEINEAGELVAYYADSTSEVLGVVVGKDGKDGRDGIDGKDGRDGKDGKDGKDGLVTSIKIDSKTYTHTNGLITLPSFTTVDYVNTVIAKKAEAIPFTVDRFVTKPVGNFLEGDNVKGLTIDELLTRLLGLTSGIEELQGIIEKIIANELPIYQVDSFSNLVETDFNFRTLTETEAVEKPAQAGFYQIVDSQGQVIESGYHQFTVDNPDYPYILALPEDIDFYTHIRVQKYDDGLLQEWVSESLELESDPAVITAFFTEALGMEVPSVPSGYKLWVALEKANDTSIYRLTIIE